MDKLLDKDVHQRFKAPSLATYLSSKTNNSSSSGGASHSAHTPQQQRQPQLPAPHDVNAPLQPIVPAAAAMMLPPGAASQAAMGLAAAVADVNAALGATAGAAAVLYERAAHAELMARTCK